MPAPKKTESWELAALLSAEDDLSDDDIATNCGIARSTLNLWKLEPEFKAKVEGHVTAFFAVIRSKGIGRLENRVRRLDRTWRGLQQVIASRAEAADITVPGMETGLIVRQVKTSREGIIEEYVVDTGTLAELRAIEKQASQELGQWTEKFEDVSKKSDEDLIREGQEIFRRIGAAGLEADGAES